MLVALAVELAAPVVDVRFRPVRTAGATFAADEEGATAAEAETTEDEAAGALEAPRAVLSAAGSEETMVTMVGAGVSGAAVGSTTAVVS